MLILLFACGGKKDEPKPAPSADIAAVVAKSTTVLDEAKLILTAKKKREPTAWVALAWAQHVAKQDAEALQSLGFAVEAARADPNDGPIVLVQVAELYWVMHDVHASTTLGEGIEALRKASFHEDKIATTLSPVVALDWEEALDRVVKLGLEDDKLGHIISRAAVTTDANNGHAWRSIENVVFALPAHQRSIATLALAQRSRLAGHPTPKVIAYAQDLANDKAPELADAAMEVALVDPKEAVKHIPAIEKMAHSQEAAQRAFTFGLLAELQAMAGNTAASEAFEKKAMQAAEKASDDELDESVWATLAIARAKRKNVAGALALVREHLKGEAIGVVAYVLVEQGERDVAQKIIEELKGEEQFTAIADIVEYEAGRGDLEQAKTRVLAAPQWKGERPGIDHVMRGYALEGDIKAVRELGAQDKGGLKSIQLDAFTDLAARMLARQGKCDEAVAATKDVVVMRGECLAVIARYCPNSKL
jgi:hypothetical protein